MKLTITVMDTENNSYDVQVDQRQRIGTTLRVMRENLPDFAYGDDAYIQSGRTRRRLKEEQTYEEANIYTGDRLWIMQKR